MIDRERIDETYEKAREDNPDLEGEGMVKIIAERMKPDPELAVEDFMRREPSLVRAIEQCVYDRERVPEIDLGDRERE